MTDQHETGGPAFPTERFDIPGMTLRDYFAAKALSGWISSKPKIMGETLDASAEMADVIAMSCYTMADAMLKARK